MSDQAAFKDPNHPGNSPEHHTGKPCIEGCGRPAGTAWSPLWCFECNAERMERIDRGFEEIRRSFEEQKRFHEALREEGEPL